MQVITINTLANLNLKSKISTNVALRHTLNSTFARTFVFFSVFAFHARTFLHILQDKAAIVNGNSE